MRAQVLALALALPVSAVAGGYEGPGADGRALQDCTALAAAGRLTPGVACVQDGRAVVSRGDVRRAGPFYELLRDRPQIEYVNGRRCPYPTRSSDSVFTGGSGYITKNEIRAVVGCAF